MSLWTLTEIEQALKIKQNLPYDIAIQSITIDSRDIQQDSLFLGLKGVNYNGSDYAIQALEKGANLCIVDHYPTQESSLREKMILVPDVYQAMISLAQYARQRFSGKLIAVTGSAGKTSTKEMLGLALSDYKTFINPGNKNNLIGAPFSLCQLPADCQFAVFEMGMNQPGELRQLSVLAQPHIAIIINVYSAHLEFFDSVADIARAKSEIFEGVLPKGCGIYFGDSPYSSIFKDIARRYNLNTIAFGEIKELNDIQLIDIVSNDSALGTSVRINIHGKVIDYNMPSNTKHIIMNSLAIIGTLQALGLNLQGALNHLQAFTPLIGRGRVYQLKNNITLIDDSYNANPGSMAAGIANLTNYRDGRLVAILGDMKELGKEAIKLHKDLVNDLIACDVDKVFVVGELMSELFTILPKKMQGLATPDSLSMAQDILGYLQPRDTILVKGSFSMNMKHIINKLLNH